MSGIQDKTDELSDIVLLPYDFPLLDPPPFVIEFLKSVDERLLDSKFSFPLDSLRDLYKKDKYLFSKIKFFLALYGCNFHSKKPTSFFPSDVNEQEEVIRYYGTKEDTFSVAEIAPLGIWDFCGYAGGSKCSYFDGVVTKRLKELDSANLEKLLSYPNFASSKELLYVKSNSSTDDLEDRDKDKKDGLSSNNVLQPEALAPELSKEEYLIDENTIEEENNQSSDESVKDSLADCAQEEAQPSETIAQEKQIAISTENSLNQPSIEVAESEDECIAESDIKIPLEENCGESVDDLSQANELGIDEQRENNSQPIPEQTEENVPFVPEGERKGICAPAFWLRFVCSFFTMSEEAKSIYHSLGYNNFEDLVELKDEDIEKIVKGIQQTGIDIYLQGAYEEELVSYCLSRKKFLKKHCAVNFLEYLSFEKYTPEVFADEDILFIDYTDRPYLIKDFDEDEDSMPDISNLYLSYLKRFGIHSLLFIGEGILQDSIDCYSLRQSDQNLRSILNPYSVVNSLCCELMGKSNEDVFALDKELSNLWINDCSDFYKFNYGKYENKKLDKRLEILSLRESGEYTLEELGQQYGVTRERIRQIQIQAIKTVKQGADPYLDLLFFRRNFVPAVFLKDIPGLIGFIKSDASSYYYCEELGIVVHKCQQNSLLKEKQLLVRDGYTVSLEDISSFYKKHGFSVFPWLNRESYHVGFSPYPYFIFKKIPMKQLGKQYLLSKGIEGFNVNEDQEEAIHFFKDNAPYLSEWASYRAIFNDIIRYGAVLRGMSTYISQELVTEEQKQVVIDVLSRTSLGTYGTTGPSIFTDNKNLLLQYGIDNGYYFYGIASFFFKDKYDFGGRGLRISPLDEAMTLEEMAEHYIVMNGPVVKVKDFLEGLHLKEPALQQIKIISKYDSNTLVRKDWFKWTKEEFESLGPFIDEKIKEKGFCHGREILNSPIYFDESKNHFLQENRIGTSASRLIYFMDGIAERFGITKYHFSHHTDCVSLASDPVETKVDMARANFKGRIFDKSILEDFYQPFKLTGSLTGSDFFEGWAVSVSLDSYALKEDVEVPDVVLEQASDILDKYYSDELYITPSSALNRVVSEGFPRKFDNHPIEFASLLSSCDKSNWANPEKDELITSNFYLNVLVNKKMIGKSSIKYSEFIREFIRSQYAGRFLSFGQITEELKKYEILNKRLTDDVLSQIFADWCDGVIVEVPE